MGVEVSLHGRVKEVGELAAILSGRGGVVVVVAGDAGIGKSRLIREALDAAGVAATWAHPEVVGTPEPYGVVLDLLENLPAGVNDAEQDDLRGVIHSSTAAGEISARQVAARLRGILSSFRDLTVVTEDLQDADELSHSVLAHLGRSAEADGLKYIWSYRSEVAPSRSLVQLLDIGSGWSRTVSLGPLDPSAVRELAAEVNPALSPQQVERLVSRAEGIPLFALELADSADDGEEEIPHSLYLAARKRLDGLNSVSRQVLEVASMVPARLEASLIARAAGMEVDEVVAAMRSAVACGLLADRDGRTVFRHGLIRDAVRDSILALERQVMSRKVVLALESEASEQSVSMGVRANLWWSAGEHEKGRQLMLQAGRDALRLGALNEAGEYFERVVLSDPPDHQRLDAEIGLSEILSREGDVDGAAAKLRYCLSLLEQSGDQMAIGEALVRLAAVHSLSDPETTVIVLDRVLGMLRSREDTEVYIRAFITKGYVLTRMLDDAVSGQEILDRGLKMADRVKSIELQAIAHDGLSWCFEEKGITDDSEFHGRAACELALTTDDYVLIARTLSAQASHSALHGQTGEALALLDVARGRIGVEAVHLLHAVDHLKAWIVWLAGRPAEADHLAALLESTRFSRIYGRVIRVWAAIERNDDWQARAILKAWWSELGGDSVRKEALSRVALLDGELSQAALCEILIGVTEVQVPDEVVEWAASYDLVCREGRPDSAGLGAGLHARALLRQGRIAEAKAVLELFDADSRMRLYPFRWAGALELRGLVALASDDLERANRLFSEAVDLLRQVENQSDLSRCLRLTAESEPDISTAKALLTEAREIASACGALREQNQVENALRTRGVRSRGGRPKGSGLKAGEISLREKEVVVLLASGATNAEIAERLFISERTVENHVSRAQRRLGLANRASLAAWAAKLGYV